MIESIARQKKSSLFSNCFYSSRRKKLLMKTPLGNNSRQCSSSVKQKQLRVPAIRERFEKRERERERELVNIPQKLCIKA